MKLWHLKQDDVEWGMLGAVVVRAANETEARRIAATCAGREGPETWTDQTKSGCYQLAVEGDPGVIVTDFFEA